MLQPSQETSLSCWQDADSSPICGKNSAEEAWVHQQAESNLVQGEIKMLWQHLEAEQLQLQREDLLQQFNKIRVWTEPQFVGRQQPRPEGSQELYSDRQQTSVCDTNHWITMWLQLMDIAFDKVMECKAQVAYASTGRNLARLHLTVQRIIRVRVGWFLAA